MEPLPERRIYAERFMKIICIGAGASGLLLAYKLSKHFSNFSLTIYEKNSDISGTWLENKYPGCACDVPSHNYTYSFEPKHDWNSVYASSADIRAYFKSFAAKYALNKYIKLGHLVHRAKWDEASGQWEIEVVNSDTGEHFQDKCAILINAGGYLNNWAWPSVPGREKFKGIMRHSANWDEDIDIKGKRVVLIGSGSSAIQILPNIQPLAQRVTTFVRSPVWILPKIASSPQVSKSDIEKYERNPDSLMKLRKYNETVMNSIYSLYLSNSPLQKVTRVELEKIMRNTLNNAALEDVLIPDFGVGCRRLNPDTGYLESIKQPNVEVVKAGVAGFSTDGCIDDHGKEHCVDIIICATGFNTTFVPRFPIIGKEGRNLQDAWSSSPRSYLGIGAAHFPNYLTFLGPYSPVANGPTLASIEAQAEHIILLLDRYQTESIHSFSPSEVAESDFVAHVKAFMEDTVYTDTCRSGHKNHTRFGRTPTLWPGSTLHYLQAMKEFRGQDWDFQYAGNRFSFLGNGLSQAEFDPTCDMAYYIRDQDDGPPLTRGGRMKVTMRTGTQPPRKLHHTHRPEVINLAPR